MQELLAIPDSKKTEAEWDELNELEISLAPVNQLVSPDKRQRNNMPNPPPQDGRPPRSAKGRKPPTRSSRRAPKAQGQGSGQGSGQSSGPGPGQGSGPGAGQGPGSGSNS